MRNHTLPKFGPIDIPLSCSVFLEPALKKFKKYISPVSRDVQNYVHDWNAVLIDTVRQPEFTEYLGDSGQKILSRTIKYQDFPKMCVDRAKDVPVQSLHYALRFSESIRFLEKKLESGKQIKLLDLGCGLSPMAGAIQKEYNLDSVYCIDIQPEAQQVYKRIAETIGGKAPEFISWDNAEEMASNHKLDTIVAMGVFPYIDLDEQVRRLKYINQYFPNFMIEIKYNNKLGADQPNIFNPKTLSQLRLSVEHTYNLETKVIENSMRYLHKFISAMPDRRYFIANNRSLFLSR